ncbi:MAG: glycosyltransferase [Actinomycetota bacterium]|nr:glycosyltransferase [Actinomycetota bacterium]
MDVTVVVVTRNRREELLRSLPRHEAPVILVDNGSDDGTAKAVRRALPAVRVAELPCNRGAAGRTVGVELASTPYVAFADDDSWWAPGALQRAAELFDAHPRMGLLAARILVGAGNVLDPICEQMGRSPLGREPDLPGPSLMGFLACAAMVRREAFCAVGGFDEVVRFPGEEERVALDLAEAGWGLAYVDEVVVHHHPSRSRDRPDERRVAIARSKLLTAVMRRPWERVRSETLGQLRSGPSGRAAALAVLPRLPAALRARRRTSDAVERDLNRLHSSDSQDRIVVYGAQRRGTRAID